MSSLDESIQQQASADTPAPSPIPAPAPSPNNTECPDCDPSDLGLKGGHFDLDTSSAVYEPNKGRTDHHVHEYDDKYNVKEVNFFNLIDKDFTALTSRISPTQEFVISIANAELSSGAILEINGVAVSVMDYQKKVDQFIAGNSAALQAYNLANLKDFKLKFSGDILKDGLLVPTATGCVRSNKPGSKGEYRNGALVIQVIDKSLVKLNVATRAAISGGGLLWEATVFWHRDGNCL